MVTVGHIIREVLQCQQIAQQYNDFMETTQKAQWGMIGLLSILLTGIGANTMFTSDQLDNAYVCTINQEVGIFNHLSSTMKTGYWLDENEILQSKVCRNGFWVGLKQYAKDNNIDINTILNGINDDAVKSQTIKGIQYKCNSTVCERIR
jgi:hypothetical protein